MACDPAQLLERAKCILTCIPPGIIPAANLAALCQAAEALSCLQASGVGYRFSSGAFYILNQDTGGWHILSFVGDQLQIEASASPSQPSGCAPVQGSNYEFSTGSRFRLIDDTGNFREFWAESGALTFDTVGTASNVGVVVISGTLFKFETGYLYIYDTITLSWLKVTVVGPPGVEQLQLG